MAQDLRRSQSNVPQTSQSGPPARKQGYSLFSQDPDEFFRMNPFQLMRRFSDEMDRMWSGLGRERRGDELSWRPVVDVRENNGQLQVHAELPGVNEKDVKVSVENDMLIMQGERKHEEEREEQGWYRSERTYGSFYRAIPLPEGAEADKANARFQNGMLEITIPVPKSQQNVRQIPISTTGQPAQSGQQPAQEKTSKASGS
jgi:HSP20 family protein